MGIGNKDLDRHGGPSDTAVPSARTWTAMVGNGNGNGRTWTAMVGNGNGSGTWTAMVGISNGRNIGKDLTINRTCGFSYWRL